VPISSKASVFKQHTECVCRRLGFLSPVFDSISAVLLPPLLALFLSALLVGHGHINAESLYKVLDMMAETTYYPVQNLCPVENGMCRPFAVSP
jgi:hypothetical protein